jgi:hypothetical protein
VQCDAKNATHYTNYGFSYEALFIIIIISIQPLGQFGQEPEPSQATGMALVRCILGKFLGVVCHCFPPCLDVPTFAARCLHVRNDARDDNNKRWNYGRERLSGNFPYMASLFMPLGIFYMPQIYDMGLMALLPLWRKAAEDFFALKNPTALAGFKPANLGTKGQHTTPRPPKPLEALSFRHNLNSSLLQITLGI